MKMRTIGLRKACVIWIPQQTIGCSRKLLKVDYLLWRWSAERLLPKPYWKDTSPNRAIRFILHSQRRLTIVCAAICMASHRLEATLFYRFIQMAELPIGKIRSCCGSTPGE